MYQSDPYPDFDSNSCFDSYNPDNPKSDPFIWIHKIAKLSGQDYIDQCNPTDEKIKCLEDFMRCGNVKIGAWYEQHCYDCPSTEVRYHKCHNRSCPRCHWIWKDQWWKKMLDKLPHCSYSMLAITIPTELHPVFYENQDDLYPLFKKACAEAVKELTEHLGLMVIIPMLQTWNNRLDYHIHCHILISNGWWDNDRDGWDEPSNPYWIPETQVMLRAKEIFLNLLNKERPDLYPHVEWLMRAKPWDIHCSPYGTEWKIIGSDNDGEFIFELDNETNLEMAVKYSSHDCLAKCWIEGIDYKSRKVTISYVQDGQDDRMYETITCVEFLDRYLQHVLPKDFRRVSTTYGLLHHTKKDQLEQVKQRFETHRGCAIEAWLNSEPANDEACESFGCRCSGCGSHTLKNNRVFYHNYNLRKQYFIHDRASPEIPPLR